MSLKPTLHLPWLEFIKLDSISSLPLHEQSEVFRKMTDPNQAIPWLTFRDLPHIVDLSIQEQTQRYKKYLDELDKIRLEQLQQVQQEQDKPVINEYDNLNWLIQRRGQGTFIPQQLSGSIVIPPHILLEIGDDLLLEDSGLIVLE
ncbi:hypothetical protein N9F16_00620 [bacterium]|nr:hypothetical protein [bacterium]